AFQNYAGAKKALPPGYTAGTDPDSTAPGWGWATYLLPYMEETTLYDQLNLTKPVETQPAIKTIISGYLCPSDPVNQVPFDVTDDSLQVICSAAPSSYAATVGDDDSEVDAPTGDGVFYRNSHTRFKEITDGLSKTAFA